MFNDGDSTHMFGFITFTTTALNVDELRKTHTKAYILRD